MASASRNIKAMDHKAAACAQDYRQQQLKCPRCDSSNTKFCYYNNYSLSQPRHFCKACKRYWTRGGTLRNVPVGGGCRKNKRARRPAAPASNGGDGVPSAASTAASSPRRVQPRLDPLFYCLPTDANGTGFNLSRLNNARVSSDSDGFEFDLQPPPINGFGLGFVQNGEYANGFGSGKQIHDANVINSISSSATSKDPIFFGSSSMASLLASSMQHQKFLTTGSRALSSSLNLPVLTPYDGMHMSNVNGVVGKDLKMEGQNEITTSWNPYSVDHQQINSSDSSLLWSSGNVGSWFDPSIMSSSVPSLI